MDVVIFDNQTKRLIEPGGKPFPYQSVELIIDSTDNPHISHDGAHGNSTVGKYSHTSDSHGCFIRV